MIPMIPAPARHETLPLQSATRSRAPEYWSFSGPSLIVAEMKSSKCLLVLNLLLITAVQCVAADSSTPLQRWFYCAQNLAVDKNIDAIDALLRRAAKAGYTHVLLTDSKFARLGEMDAHYFRNIDRVKTLAAELHLEIVPA